MSRQGLSDLIDRLQRAGLDFDGEDLADILWLAQQIQATDDRSLESIAPELSPVELSQPQPEPALPQLPELTEPQSEPIASEPAAIAALPPTIPDPSPSPDTTAPDGAIAPPLPAPDRPGGLPFRAPAAPALRQVRELERALRPLTRKVPSPTAYELDEAATVEQVADRDWWMPVLRPAAERWLDVALVVEDSPAIALWERVIEDWQALLGRVGAFRDVRVWSLQSTGSGAITIAPRTSSQTAQGRSVSPKQLIDPSGRRLILFMSDCTSALWRAEPLQDVLKTWAASGSLALVQLLPERLWRRTALVAGYGVQLSATLPGQASDRLAVSGLPVWEEVETAGALRLPVVTIEPGPLARWARMVAGAGDAPSAGVLFEPGTVWRPRVATGSDQPDPEAIVRQFWAVASPLAKELAGYLAAVPVSLDVLHLIQAALLPESSQVHAAEVFMGGLIERVGEDAAGLPVYDFREGVRSWLVGSMPRSQTELVLNKVSEQIADRLGIAPRGFKALLLDSADLPEGAIAEVQAFARIARSTLLRMGGEFAALGDRLDPEVVEVVGRAEAEMPAQETVSESLGEEAIDFPPLMEIAFEEGYLELEEFPESFQQQTQQQEMQMQMQMQALIPEPALLESLLLEWFTFETAITLLTDQKSLRIERFSQNAKRFIEQLPDGLGLEMVLLSGGQFLMGAPAKEFEASDNERPRHPVNIQGFLIGKYPVTQAQWRAIASLPKVEIDLSPSPSWFTESARERSTNNHPVEQVNWHQATEACARLAQFTGRPYRLPSEAEWEYACRAGTNTPFYCGENISSELANYNGNYTYSNSPKGIYRQRTSAVGSFPANDWGIYDMHGNVWEWCADLWYANYDGAPKDGSVWLKNTTHDLRILRGGSYLSDPRLCRSATRNYLSPNYRDTNIGFRVCCAVAQTPEVDVEE